MTPSQLAWLDHSAEDQRRVRDILRLFSDTESRDELGLGQIRDAYSDILFPGTSVLLTRARYLLFVPWCFQAAQGERTPESIVQRAHNYERGLIPLLAQDPGIEGLIGRRAGIAVQTLPSTIYATALRRYAIQLGDVDQPSAMSDVQSASEVTDRVQGVWHRQLPPRPPGFPQRVSGGFELTRSEAEFLKGRIESEVPGSYLSFLVADSVETFSGDTPWDDPAVRDAPGSVQHDLRLAQTFSEMMHGASLLYNVLIAEAYEAKGYSDVQGRQDLFRDRLEEWADLVAAARPRNTWAEVRARAVMVNPRVNQNLRLADFGAAWFDRVEATGGRGAADDDQLRGLVYRREYAVKHAQSRLVNDKLLRSWSGSSGAGQLTYRWLQVRRIVSDIMTGLQAGVGV